MSREEYNQINTIDLALKLKEDDEKQIKKVCQKLKDENLAIVLEEADERVQLKIVELLDNNRLLNVFNYMPKDDIVDILGKMNIGKAKEIINLMKEGDKKVIEQLLGYKADCAGGIMTTEYIALYSTLTIEEVIKKIKEIEPKTEVIETIYVIDDNKTLVGTANLRDILVAPSDVTLLSITDTDYVYVEPETDQEEVAQIVSKYNLNAIPVLNKSSIILGIITIDDIVDVIEEEQTEDVLKMGGVAKEERLDSTLGESIRLRLPWLFVNLITAFLAAMTVKGFEDTISKVVALSATMSIVTGMGGNAGTQTVSIIIRNIAMGKIELKDSLHLLVKEILLGLINGAAIGLVTGIVVALIYGNFYLGLIIFLAMIGNLIISGIFGLLVPLVLEKLHKDPALASSIFLTTATDVLGFFIFLSLAQAFIKFLV